MKGFRLLSKAPLRFQYPLFLLLLLAIASSCNTNHETLEEPPALVFKKTALLNGGPALDLNFKQTFSRDENGKLTSSKLSVQVRNLANVLVDALRYEVIIYDSELRNSENILLKSSKWASALGANDTTVYVDFVENYFAGELDPAQVQVNILQYSGGSDLGGAYEGYYSAFVGADSILDRIDTLSYLYDSTLVIVDTVGYDSLNMQYIFTLAYAVDSSPVVDSVLMSTLEIEQQRPAQASVTADGQVTVWIAGSNPIKKIEGTLAPNNHFLGVASILDGTQAFEVETCDSCEFIFNSTEFTFEIVPKESPNPVEITRVRLQFVPTSKKN